MATKKIKAAEAADKGAAPGTVTTVKGKVEEFKEFLELSKVELKKVTWPTRKETLTTSMAVMVLVVVMSLFLGVVDVGLSKLIQHILS